MINLITIAGAFVPAYYIKNIWLAILASFAIGTLGSILMSFLFYYFKLGSFAVEGLPPGAVVLSAAVQMVLNTIVAFIGFCILRFLVFRKKFKK